METCKSSYALTADAIVYSGPCLLCGVQLIGDGTNQANLVLYDGTAATSKIVFEASTSAQGANASGPAYVSKNFPRPIKCLDGLYGDITGTGASYIVEYVEV